MLRRPPRSTRTDTLFPFTTLFRSTVAGILSCKNISSGRFAPNFVTILACLRLKRCLSHRTKFRSEEHTSELQSLMCTSYAVFCSKNKNNQITHNYALLSPDTHQSLTTNKPP